MKNLRVETCNTFCSPCNEQECDECPLHALLEERDAICALLGVEDPLKGVEATLEKLARLKEAVNTFPLWLLMSGENAEGKREHRFVNLVTPQTSPAYEDVVQAILAGHEFYKENPGFILEVTSIGVGLPGPVEQDECDG
jgi:hypothetical protein